MYSLLDFLPRRPVRSVCFTGHRQLRMTDRLNDRLRETLEALIDEGAKDFYAGGARGWDAVCTGMVFALRAKYPDIRLHLILPCPINEQVRDDEGRRLMRNISERADDVEILSPRYYDGCMKKRNLRLVEAADCCVCWYDSSRFASGTGQTVRLAEHKGIKVINLLE